MDTLVALQALARHSCLKLQCLTLRVMADTGRAHRALDDCVSLRQVAAALVQGVGMSLPNFLVRFAVELDLPSSLAQLSMLMDPPQIRKSTVCTLRLHFVRNCVQRHALPNLVCLGSRLVQASMAVRRGSGEAAQPETFTKSNLFADTWCKPTCGSSGTFA